MTMAHKRAGVYTGNYLTDDIFLKVKAKHEEMARHMNYLVTKADEVATRYCRNIYANTHILDTSIPYDKDIYMYRHG